MTHQTHTVRLILANGAQYAETIRAASPSVAPVELAKAKGYGKSDIYVAQVDGKAIQLR